MSSSKTKKIISIAALVLCLAFAATFVLAFTACDEENASADSGLTWGQAHGYVIGGGSTYKNDGGEDVYEEMPETLNSEIVEPVFVENPNATITGEFDENGVAPCVFYNTKESLTAITLEGIGCIACRGECKGHNGFVAYDGYTSEDYFYPYTIAPISTTAETAEIQCTLIFKKKPEVDGTIFSNFSWGPEFVTISSLTGESLDVARFTQNEVIYYVESETCGEYGYLAYDEENHDGYRVSSEYSIAYLHGIEKDAMELYRSVIVNGSSYWVYTVELANGDEYEYGVKFFDSTRL